MHENEPWLETARNLWGFAWRWLTLPALCLAAIFFFLNWRQEAELDRQAEMRRMAEAAQRVESKNRAAEEEKATAMERIKLEAAERSSELERIRSAEQALASKEQAERAKAAQVAEEEQLRDTSVRSSQVLPRTLALVVVDPTGIVRWDVADQLVVAFKEAGITVDTSLFTQVFFRTKYFRQLVTKDVDGVLSDLRLKGRIRGIILAEFSSVRSNPDTQGFVTADIHLGLTLFDGAGARKVGAEITASGAGLRPEISEENAMERLLLSNHVRSKLMAMDL